MRLRREQIDAFGALALENANRELCDYARRRFPDLYAEAPAEELAELARRVRALAGEHGFEREEHVATVLDLVVMYEEGFPQSDWARPILEEAGLTPDDRIELLLRELRRNGVAL